jgi:hypothetical protein
MYVPCCESGLVARSICGLQKAVTVTSAATGAPGYQGSLIYGKAATTATGNLLLLKEGTNDVLKVCVGGGVGWWPLWQVAVVAGALQARLPSPNCC